MVSDFSGFADTPTATARNQRLVVPDNDADLPDGVCKVLEVISPGTVVCVAENDTIEQAVTRTDMAAGRYILCRVRRVLTGTTATVVALY